MRLLTYSLPSALLLSSLWTGTGLDLSTPVSLGSRRKAGGREGGVFKKYMACSGHLVTVC